MAQQLGTKGPVHGQDGAGVSSRKKQGSRPKGCGSRVPMICNSARKKRMILSKGRGRPPKNKGMSISSSSSLSRIRCGDNGLLENKEPVHIALGVWELGKNIGLDTVGLERQIIKKLEGMEVRDRMAAGKISGNLRNS